MKLFITMKAYVENGEEDRARRWVQAELEPEMRRWRQL